MDIIKSKYTVNVLSLISTAMCLFPMLSGKIATGEAYTSVIRGYNLLEFSAWGITAIISPWLVPLILYGCQSRAAKELELMALMIGNIVCYVHSVNNVRIWLYDIGASVVEMKAAMFLYPINFILLCITAIIKNASDMSEKPLPQIQLL